MKKFITFFVILFTITSINSLTAQFNPDSLQVKINRIVKNYVDTNSAGMVVGVIRKDGVTPVITHRYTFGHIRKDTTSPRPDSLTIFHIGSVTKSYTATILSMLIQQGGPINLRDFVEDHIPLDSVRAPFYVTPQHDTVKMTILDLATHYSALPDDPIQPIHDSTSYPMMYKYLNSHQLSRAPGQCFLYSNLGVSFLGVVVTNTLGEIIDSLFIHKLCDTLDMPDTRITLTPQQEHRRPVGYLSNGDSVGYFKNSWPAFYAAGGLYTTIKDFMKYLQFNMGMSNIGMQSVLDSAHKIRRVSNDTCENPDSKGRVGLVWQMALLNPQTDSSFYFTWKDGGVPGFSSFICFTYDAAKNLKSGVVMISNFSIPVDKLAIEILKYLNADSAMSGVSQISQNIPDNFKLYQNYPNPFNPSTKIKFDITQDIKQQTQDVKLIVYDVLGKEVEALVNEKLLTGSYETEFNGTNFPSGVYFYKLTIGNYKEIKKMFLVK
ncbi:MAG: serine hydrolase [bacterium]